MTQMTIEDIRNPDRKSGFDYVGANGPHDSWRAQKIGQTYKGNSITYFRGPTRATPEEAAEDFVAYATGADLPRRKSRKRLRVRRQERRPGGGRRDVAIIDGTAYFDRPPEVGPYKVPAHTVTPSNAERRFMDRCADDIEAGKFGFPEGSNVEVAARVDHHTLCEELGELLFKATEYGTEDKPYFLLVPEHPHPDYEAVLRKRGVTVVVP